MLGTGVALVQRFLDGGLGGAPASSGWQPGVPWPTLAWLDALDATWAALPVALPFALATVIGGIDNTESALAAGDRYATRDILLTEALAILAGLAGGIIQNTPYIGHPAYKAMGARAGYTLATGLVIGLGAMAGLVSALVRLVPGAAVAPILIFIRLEITAQAFLATPPRHAPAVALAFVPVVAGLVLLQVPEVLTGLGRSSGPLPGDVAHGLETLRVLGNGFVVTALLWGATGALIVDRRLGVAAGVAAVAALASLCGVIHSPLESGGLFWPRAVASPGRSASPGPTACWQPSSWRWSLRHDRRGCGPAPGRAEPTPAGGRARAAVGSRDLEATGRPTTGRRSPAIRPPGHPAPRHVPGVAAGARPPGRGGCRTGTRRAPCHGGS